MRQKSGGLIVLLSVNILPNDIYDQNVLLIDNLYYYALHTVPSNYLPIMAALLEEIEFLINIMEFCFGVNIDLLWVFIDIAE